MNFCWCLCIPGNNNRNSPEFPHGPGPGIFIQYCVSGAGGWEAMHERSLKWKAVRRLALDSNSGRKGGALPVPPPSYPLRCQGALTGGGLLTDVQVKFSNGLRRQKISQENADLSFLRVSFFSVSWGTSREGHG